MLVEHLLTTPKSKSVDDVDGYFYRLCSSIGLRKALEGSDLIEFVNQVIRICERGYPRGVEVMSQVRMRDVRLLINRAGNLDMFDNIMHKIDAQQRKRSKK